MTLATDCGGCDVSVYGCHANSRAGCVCWGAGSIWELQVALMLKNQPANEADIMRLGFDP